LKADKLIPTNEPEQGHEQEHEQEYAFEPSYEPEEEAESGSPAAAAVVEPVKPATPPKKPTSTLKKPTSPPKTVAMKPATHTKPAKPAPSTRRAAAKKPCHTYPVRKTLITSIGKLFKSLKAEYDGDLMISVKAVCAVDAILREQLEKIGEECHNMLQKDHVQTLKPDTIFKAVRLLYTDKEQKELLKAGISDSGIVSHARVERLLREMRVAPRYAGEVRRVLSAVLEEIAAMVLTEGIVALRDAKGSVLKPRHLLIGLARLPGLRLRGTFGPAVRIVAPAKRIH
jgi:histone H3/H4